MARPVRKDLVDPDDVTAWFLMARRAQFASHRMARLCGFSERQLRRHAQRRLGRSLQGWLEEQRLVAAGPMLRESRSVKVVAIDLRFKQLSHFSRQFTRFYGLSAREFLRLHERRLAAAMAGHEEPSQTARRSARGRAG